MEKQEDILKRVKLLMGYDMSMTLNENLIFLEQKTPTPTELPKPDIVVPTLPSDKTQTTVFNPTTGRYQQSNPVKPSDYGLKEFPKVLQSKGMSTDEFVEKLREQLYSPAGIAIDTFLMTFGVPEVPMVAYSGLLIWDINKSFTSGDIKWGDILFDILGVITAGILMGEAAGSRFLLKKVKSLEEGMNVLKNTSFWKKLIPYLDKLKNGTQWLLNIISKGFKWLTDKLGLSFIVKVWTKISTFIENLLSKIVSFLGGSQRLSKAVGVGGKTYTQQSAVVGTVKTGVDTYKKTEGEEEPKIDLDYKPTEDEITKASQIDFQ